jgi:acyl transferase domain-containing protein
MPTSIKTMRDQGRPMNVLGGYLLKSSLKEFDPTLFSITPVEAMWMDP